MSFQKDSFLVGFKSLCNVGYDNYKIIRSWRVMAAKVPHFLLALKYLSHNFCHCSSVQPLHPLQEESLRFLCPCTYNIAWRFIAIEDLILQYLLSSSKHNQEEELMNDLRHSSLTSKTRVPKQPHKKLKFSKFIFGCLRLPWTPDGYIFNQMEPQSEQNQEC